MVDTSLQSFMTNEKNNEHVDDQHQLMASCSISFSPYDRAYQSHFCDCKHGMCLDKAL